MKNILYTYCMTFIRLIYDFHTHLYIRRYKPKALISLHTTYSSSVYRENNDLNTP